MVRSIFPSLVNCMAVANPSRQVMVPPRMELSRQGRGKAVPLFFSVLALAYFLHRSLFFYLVRTVSPFLAAGSPAKRSHLRRSYKVQVSVLCSQLPVNQGQAFLVLMVHVVKTLMKIFAGVSTSSLCLGEIAFSVEWFSAAKHVLDDDPYFM